MKNLVSIIIPCYNQAKFLDDTLNSILLQAHQNWECIIINDGSTDNTEQVASYWTKQDERFKYISKSNGGLSSARNAGLEIAKGHYIQFLDADDCLHQDKFMLSIDLINKKKSDIIISNFNLFFSLDKLQPPYCILKQEVFNLESVLYQWDSGYSIPIHCGFFKSNLFTNFRFPEHLKAKEDWIMWVSLFYKNECTALFLDKSLAYYRSNPLGMTKTSSLLPEYLKAITYLKRILNEDEFEKLYLGIIDREHNSLRVFKSRLSDVKKSNTYQTGLMIKKILKSLGILKFSRKLFPFFLKFKSK